MESQVNPELEGRVLKYAKPWTLEYTNAGLVISNGWMTNWIICYGNGKWASDWLVTNKKIKEWLDKNCDLYS